MGLNIKSKEHAIRDAKFNEEMAKRQTEALLRYGNTEDVVMPPDSIDILSAQKEIARLQVFPCNPVLNLFLAILPIEIFHKEMHDAERAMLAYTRQ